MMKMKMNGMKKDRRTKRNEANENKLPILASRRFLFVWPVQRH